MSPTSGMAFQHTRIKENVAKHSNHVKHEEDIEVAEPNRLQCLRTELSKDKVEHPVRKRRSRISESANFDGKNLSLTTVTNMFFCNDNNNNIRSVACFGVVLSDIPGYTHEMIPRGV